MRERTKSLKDDDFLSKALTCQRSPLSASAKGRISLLDFPPETEVYEMESAARMAIARVTAASVF